MMSGQHHENVVPNLQPGVRFYFSNVTTNGYVPFHWHSSLEIITVVKGHLRFTLNGQVYHVRDNQFIVIPPGSSTTLPTTPIKPTSSKSRSIHRALLRPSRKRHFYQSSPSVTCLPTGCHPDLRIRSVDPAPRRHDPFDFGITLLTILKLLFQEFRTEQPYPPSSAIFATSSSTLTNTTANS